VVDDHPTRDPASASASGSEDTPPAGTQPELDEHVLELEVTVEAQRRLLRARRPSDAVDALSAVVHRLGATLVDGEVSGAEVLPIDVALGVRPPTLPWAPPDEPARARLQRILPGLVDDAGRVVHRLWLAREHGDTAQLDELTGTLHSGAIGRLLGKLEPGDAVLACTLPREGTLALDGSVSRADLTLRNLAELLRSELDVDERLGRLDPVTLVVAVPHVDDARLEQLIERVATRWERDRPAVPLLTATVHVVARTDDLAQRVQDQLDAARRAFPHGPTTQDAPDLEVEVHDSQ
jgi:hypothetical protein